MADDVTGGSPGQSGSTGSTAPQPSSTAPAEPSVIDTNDDTLIRVKGSDKPVKFGDHVRGFQSQFTKASQKAAALQKELDSERAARRQYESQRQQQGQGQQQQGQPDVYAAIKQLPYLSGQDAAGLAESISGQIQQRDQVLLAALKKMQQMESVLSNLNNNHASQSFEGKISKWLQAGGYDPGYGDLAKEIYLAYEGDDLDAEFPQIFASRVEQIEKLMEARRQNKLNANKRQPFIPGRAQNVGPSKELQIKPDATAKEIAEQLWGGWSENGT